MPVCRAVLFDLDGVLIDSYALWFTLLRRATIHFGFPPLTDAAYRPTWGGSMATDVERFMPGTPLERLRAFVHEHYCEHLDHVRRDPAALRVLQEVRGAATRPGGPRRVGCVSNTPRTQLCSVLEHTDMLGHLDHIVGGDDVPRPKPAPDGPLRLCTLLGVAPEEAVLVGDTGSDRDAAAAAGIPLVGLRLDGPHRLEDLAELPAWLDAWERGRLSAP